MSSLKVMLEKLEGMLDTNDLTQWEQAFVSGLLRYKSDTTKLSEKQITIIERLYNKHFA